MKKIAAILLAALLFAGCTPKPAEPSGISEPENTELPVSSSELPSSTDTWAGQREPVAIPAKQSIISLNAAIAEDGTVYYMADSLICRFDREQNDFVPVCDRQGCAHDAADCPARLGKDAANGFLSLRERRLWFADREPSGVVALYSLDPESCERKQELELPKIDTDLPGTLDVGVVCNDLGDLFLIQVWPSYFPDVSLQELPESSRMQRVILFDPQTGETTEPLTELVGENYGGFYSEFGPFAKFGDTLYAMQNRPYLNEEEKNPHNDWERILIRVNCKTGELKRTRVEASSTAFSGLCITETALLYVRYDGDFVELDPETGEKRVFASPAERAVIARYDDQYITLETHRQYDEHGNESGTAPIVFLDREYRKLDEIVLPDRIYPMINTADRLYVGRGETIVGWLDKSQIGSGKLELIPLGRDDS